MWTSIIFVVVKALVKISKVLVLVLHRKLSSCNFLLTDCSFWWKTKCYWLGLAIWREWWLWFCSKALWDDSCSLLSWSGCFHFNAISPIRGNPEFSNSSGTMGYSRQGILVLWSFFVFLCNMNFQIQQKADVSISRLCFSLSSYLYFLVTKKSLRLQVSKTRTCY